MNLGEIRDEVVSNAFSATIYNSLVTRWANMALGRIGRRVPSLQRNAVDDVALVAGTAAYSTPADMIRLRQAAITARRLVLLQILDTDLDALSDSRGIPRALALISDTQLQVWPTPSSAMTLNLRYWAAPAPLADDDDEPDIPADYHDLLVLFCRAKCFQKEDDPEMHDQLMARFESDLLLMRSDLARPSTMRQRRTPSMFAADSRSFDSRVRP